jgi:MFS family permease
MNEVPESRKSALRHSLRMVVLAWVFGAGWMYITTGAAVTRFAKLLAMPKFGFGILAAIPFASALIQLPTSYFIERYGHRKGFFITTGVIHRGLWTVVAFIPWLLPKTMQWQGFLLVIAVSWVFGQMPVPIWVSWMADLVPGRIRGRYFSRRSQIGQIIGLVVTICVGVVLDRAEIIGPKALLRTASIALLVGGVLGTIDFFSFFPVMEFHRPKPNPEISLGQIVHAPLRDRNFWRFLGFTATLTFSVGYVNQFIWLYLFDVAGMSNTQANTMLVSVPLVIFLVSYPIWGKLTDRFGRKPILIIAGLLFAPGAIAWIFVTKQHWIAGYACAMIATAAWPGIDVANFNILLKLSEATDNTKGTRGYVAINSAVSALAGILSGLFGGIVAERLGDWTGSLAGWPLTYHGVLFIISTGIRVLSVVWLIDLVDEGSATPRVALRYMGTNLYSNIQQGVYIPGRLLWQIGRWTYKLKIK